MSTFSIDKAALIEIQRMLSRSKCREPVARLHEKADPGHLFDQLKTAVLGGMKSEEELSAIGKKRYEEVGDQLQFSLAVSDFERSDYPSADLVEINGITFAMSADVRDLLRNYCLTFENGRFLLRSPDKVVHTLRSLISAPDRP